MKTHNPRGWPGEQRPAYQAPKANTKAEAAIPKILLATEVNEMLLHWVDLADGEVSGLGLVEEQTDDGGLITALKITKVFLPKQTCTGANTELDQDSVARVMMEIPEPSKLRLWWHSHGDMDTFWSGTDDDTIRRLANDGLLLSVVLNKAGKMLARLDQFTPLRVTIDDLPVFCLYPDLGLRQECEILFKDRVTEIKQTVIPDRQRFWNGSHRGFDQEDWSDFDLEEEELDEVEAEEVPQVVGGSRPPTKLEILDELDRLHLAGEMSMEEYNLHLRALCGS